VQYGATVFVDRVQVGTTTEEEIEGLDTRVRIACFQTEIVQWSVEVAVSNVDLNEWRREEKMKQRVVAQRRCRMQRCIPDSVAHIEFACRKSARGEERRERRNVSTLHSLEHGSDRLQVLVDTPQHPHT
jgi:uncharacterized protein (DUF2132 family)